MKGRSAASAALYLVKSEDECGLLGLQIVIGVRNAFGDALEDMRLAQIIGGKEVFQVFERDVGIDGHA